jgi:hypothetical protein
MGGTLAGLAFLWVREKVNLKRLNKKAEADSSAANKSSAPKVPSAPEQKQPSDLHQVGPDDPKAKTLPLLSPLPAQTDAESNVGSADSRAQATPAVETTLSQ